MKNKFLASMASAVLLLLICMVISGCGSGSYPFYNDSESSNRPDAYDAEMDKDLVDEYANVQSEQYYLSATEQALDENMAEFENKYWEDQQNKEAEIENRMTATQEALEWEFESSQENVNNGDCNIKGNISFGSGEKIYHMPGQKYYESTVIDLEYGERWFCTETEALNAGWRRAAE